jgi:asparagine synthase (glutamine-hydrolysing)
VSGLTGIVDFGDGAVVESGDAMSAAAPHRTGAPIRIGRSELSGSAAPWSPDSVSGSGKRVGGAILVAGDIRLDNRVELCRLLRSHGYVEARGATDRELVAAAYQYWGRECATHLVGDFAFAIWDEERRAVFAARDPMGLRPFYYRADMRRIVFASEVKQILAVPGLSQDLFEPAIAAHLLGYAGSLEWTFYSSVAQLKPAHALWWQGGEARVWRFWDVDPAHRIEYRRDEEYAEHFRELFLEAVRCRIEVDRPIGVFLSGGLDSGSVASAAGRLMREGHAGQVPDLHAYCFAYETLTECDERFISDHIVEQYGLVKTDVPAEEAWPLSSYPAGEHDADAPMMGAFGGLFDRSLEIARADGVGMMMTGFRGDAIVGQGIADYPGLLRRLRIGALYRDLKAHSEVSGIPLPVIARSYLVKPLVVGALATVGLSLPRRPAGAESDWRTRWIAPGFLRRADPGGIARASEVPIPTKLTGPRRRRYETVFWPEQMRMAVEFERCLAKFCIATTDPWSDRRLAEFVIASPQWAISRPDESKWLSREAMRGVMPEEARVAARKILLEPLFERGLRDRGRETIEALLTRSRRAEVGFVDEAALRDHHRRILAGERIQDNFWAALSLEMWLRRHHS